LVQIEFDVKFHQLPFSKQKDGKADGSMTRFVPGCSLKCARLVLDELDAGAPGKLGM
jgi:hypothetical protein